VMTTVTAGRSGPGGAVEDSDKKRVMQQQRFDGTIGDFMKMLQKETGIFSRHWHVYREQAGAYHRMEDTYQRPHIACVARSIVNM